MVFVLLLVELNISEGRLSSDSGTWSSASQYPHLSSRIAFYLWIKFMEEICSSPKLDLFSLGIVLVWTWGMSCTGELILVSVCSLLLEILEQLQHWNPSLLIGETQVHDHIALLVSFSNQQARTFRYKDRWNMWHSWNRSTGVDAWIGRLIDPWMITRKKS